MESRMSLGRTGLPNLKALAGVQRAIYVPHFWRICYCPSVLMGSKHKDTARITSVDNMDDIKIEAQIEKP